MFNKVKTFVFGLAASVGLISSPALAAAVDVTAVTADIAAQAAPIAAVGAAVLILMLGIKAFKWIRRAM